MKKHLSIIIFCFFYLIFSLLTFKSYGVTTDEPLEYASANKLIDYFTSPLNFSDVKKLYKLPEDELRHEALLSSYYRGHLIPHALLFSKDSYFELHLLNMLLAIPLFVIVYLTFFKYFQKWYLSILAPLFLFFDPRIFGHIPANPKDFPFAMWFLILICLFYLLKDYQNTYIKNIILGLSFGLVISIRPLGISILPIYIFYLIHNYYFNSKSNFKDNLKNLLSQLIIAGLFVCLTWPFIGANPIRNFIFYLFESSKFTGWNGSTLFNGELVQWNEIPKNYLYVWLGITTPLIHIALILIGLINFKRYYKNSLITSIFFGIILNLIIYSTVNPLIYNGYRHYLFLITLITFLSSFVLADTINLFSKSKYFKYYLVSIIILSLSLMKDFVSLHPYQYIYFNELSGGLKNNGNKFDTDYWFESRIEAVDWVMKNTDYKNESVYACNMPYILEYYSDNKLKVSKDIDDSTISICDPKRDIEKEIKGEVIKNISRERVTLTIIKRLK